MGKLLRRLAVLLRLGRFETELAEEMEFHREMAQREKEERGLPPGDAAVAAQRSFGNPTLVLSRARDVWIWAWLVDVGLDVRFAFRLFIRERRLAAGAAAALGLCIGASTTSFAVLNVQMRGLPGDSARRIVRLSSVDKTGSPLRFSYREFEALSAVTAFDGLAAYNGVGIRLSEDGRSPEPAAGAYVSASAFQLLRETPILGRSFVHSDDRPGAPPTILLGYRVWQNRFNGDPAVVGRTVVVNDAPATVIGVMRPGFRFPMVSDSWLPLAATSDVTEDSSRRNIDVFGRLAAGRPLSDAVTQLATWSERFADQFPDTNRETRVAAEPFVDTNAAALWVGFVAATGLLLIIGCVNVANLLLARAISRSPETAIRLAQGATRWRLVRLCAVESLLLALIAGVGGVGLAVMAFRLIATNLAGINFPYWVEWTLDARAFAFAALAAITAAVFISTGPVLHIWKLNPNEALTERGRSGIGGVGIRRMMMGLIAVELTLTVALVAAAGLMTRSFVALYRADSNIDPSNVLLTRVTLPPSRYPTLERQTAFFNQVTEHISASRAVSAVTTATSVPFIGSPRVAFETETHRDGSPQERPTVSLVEIGEGYWTILRSALVRGRPFTVLDGTPGHESVIINERLASMYFGTEDALGRRIRLTAPNAADKGAWLEIVGIAPNVRHQQTFGLRDLDPVAYVPFRGGAAAWLLIRRGSEQVDLVPSDVRGALAALDPALPLARYMVSLDDYMAQSRWPNRIFAALFAAFAAISVVLSALGLFAVTSYAVTRRIREIGIRVALGARPAQVTWLFLGQAVRLLCVGAGFGLLGALGVGQLLTMFLMQTKPNDVLTLAGTVALLIAVVAVASVWPTLRAARMDAWAVLRHE